MSASDGSRSIGGAFLRRLSAEEIDALRQRAVTRDLPSGTEIFQRGDDAAGLYWIERGAVEVFVESAEGRQLVLRRLRAGELFGEIAALDRAPRTASARTVADSQLLYLDRREFRALLVRKPELALKLLEHIAERLRLTTEHLEDNAFLPMRARLAKLLLSLASEQGGRGETTRITEPLSQRLLARIVLTNREEVNREMKRWERAGWLRRAGDEVEILDPDALEDLVQEG